MCKLMFVIGAKKNSKLRDFCLASAPIITKTNNDDGFGYIAVKNDGAIFSEKWVNNDDAFKGNPLSHEDSKIISAMDDFIDAPKEVIYNTIGKKEWSKTTSVLMHARMKTNGAINIDNTHPFNRENTFVVHNGVVRNPEKFGVKNGQCDSISFLNQYLANKVADNASNIRDALEPMQGYWAVGVATTLGKGEAIIDVFTSKTATDTKPKNYYNKGTDFGGSGTLAMTYVSQLDGYVLATKQSDIETVIKELKWTHNNKFFPVNEKRMLRFNAITGDTLDLIDHSGLTITNIKSNNQGNVNNQNSTTHNTGNTTNTQSRGSLPESTTKNTTGGKSGTLTVVNNTRVSNDDVLSGTANFFYKKQDCYTEVPCSLLQSQKDELEFDDDDDLTPTDTKYTELNNNFSLLTDSRYPNSRDEITDEMQDLLDDYFFALEEWEQEEMSELPDDLKYKALLDHYNDSRYNA